MAEDVGRLFDEYAARYARGERPDVRDYLARAGEAAGELAGLVDRFLQATSPPPPGEEARALARAFAAGESPLLELRTSKGVRRAALVDALVERLGLDPARREKVTGYLHELEAGLLEPARVSGRVWEALAERLGARARDLAAFRPRPPESAERAFLRAPEVVAAPSIHPPAERADEWDEIDELFLGPLT